MEYSMKRNRLFDYVSHDDDGRLLLRGKGRNDDSHRHCNHAKTTYAIPHTGAILSRSHPKMIKADWETAARSFPFRIELEGNARATSKTKHLEMASRPILHLLIACGVFAATTSLNSNQRFSNQLFDNRPNRGQVQEVSSPKRAVSCPERNGRYPVQNQCDAYIECIDGEAEEKLCPEGLVFNPEARFNYPCGYPIDVDCTGRPNLQPANPTEHCPHQYGYFKIGDQQQCGQFMNCVDGRSYVFDCPEGLAFNPESYRCDWPDQVPDCDAEAFLGFRCPETPRNSFFLGSVTKFYRSSVDCHHYYICVNDRPRLQSCGIGNAFNELIDACDAAENVTGCEHEAIVRTTPQFEQTRLF